MWGDTIFPLSIKGTVPKRLVWGDTIFPLSMKGTFSVGGTLFFPLIIGKKNLNSVNLYLSDHKPK